MDRTLLRLGPGATVSLGVTGWRVPAGFYAAAAHGIGRRGRGLRAADNYAARRSALLLRILESPASANNLNAVPPHRVESGQPQPSEGVTACVSNPLAVCDLPMILAGPVSAEACAPQSKQPGAVLL
jgi:hypothetical protein